MEFKRRENRIPKIGPSIRFSPVRSCGAHTLHSFFFIFRHGIHRWRKAQFEINQGVWGGGSASFTVMFRQIHSNPRGRSKQRGDLLIQLLLAIKHNWYFIESVRQNFCRYTVSQSSISTHRLPPIIATISSLTENSV